MTRAIHAIALVVLGLFHPLATANDAHGAELLMFDSKLCEWCARWREEIGPIYPKTEEGKIAPLKSIDVHRPRPPAYKSIKGVVYTPTFVLWHDGREIGRIVGYTGEAFFWGLLGELIEDMRAGREAPPTVSGAAPVSGTPVPAEVKPER